MIRFTHEKMRKFFAGAAALILFCAVLCRQVRAADLMSLLMGDQETQIYPMEDGSGKYLVKSDGFFCVGKNGELDRSPCVHYFDRVEINGTVFNGYYYHDEDGIFHAGNDRLVHMASLSCGELEFEGFYMVGNLGRLSAAPQVRYLEGVAMKGLIFNGYYFFNETGRLVREPGIHTLDMEENGRLFQGSYYFGGSNAALSLEGGVTPEGFPVDENGKVDFSDGERMQMLGDRLNSMILEYDGEWGIYVKNLETDEELVINDRPMTSASLIKTFILEKTYKDLETVRENEAAQISSEPESAETEARIQELLWNMITVSDNESSNELVRLQTASHDFAEGARNVNEYLSAQGYAETSVQHTLHPSASSEEGLGGSNITSVKDCGRILERIYDGTCVSQSASEEMKNLLLNQETTWKIPAGIPENVPVANKTGETDDNQHDIAIVYAPAVPYILCVMTEGCEDEGDAITGIQNISGTVYNCLNLYEYAE